MVSRADELFTDLMAEMMKGVSGFPSQVLANELARRGDLWVKTIRGVAKVVGVAPSTVTTWMKLKVAPLVLMPDANGVLSITRPELMRWYNDHLLRVSKIRSRHAR